MKMQPSQRHLLSIPSFRRFVAAQTSAALAYQILSLAVAWQIYDLTRSAFSLGLIGLVQFLPQFLLSLVVGHVADRYDRRRIILSCFLIEGAMTAVLAVGSFIHCLNRELILACVLLIGAARAFENPTMQAFLPMLVEPAILPECFALSATGRQIGSILGPALGGIIYIAGAGSAYTVIAACYCLAALLYFGIPSPVIEVRRQPPTLKSVFDGIAYIRSKPDILGAISLDLFSVLLGGATALLPIYARDILSTGPWGLGLLRAAPAVGALVMSVYLVRRPFQHRIGKIMFTAVAGFAIATIVFGLSRSFLLSLAALTVLGATDMISVVIRSTLVQLETPNEKRGRVSAVNFIFIGASNQLGEFESGVTAAWFGTVPAVVIGGIGTLFVVALWMRLFPGLVRRDVLIPENL
ncbi:MAG: MFS transporter [Desulfobaccales bacterium]